MIAIKVIEKSDRMPLKVRTNFSNVIDDIEPNLRYLVTEEFTYMKLIKKIQRYH